MFRGFHLKMCKDEMIKLRKDAGYKVAPSPSKKHCKPKFVGELEKYLVNEKIIDAEKLEFGWFPQIQADIFLSHSHKDIGWVRLLKQFLEKEFSLRVFIDSDVWGYSLDLVKEIEKKFNGMASHDIICSHVNIMLAASLSRMLDQTDYVFFLNTPNTISLDDSHEERTSSEWIYHELLVTSLLRSKEPRYVTAAMQESQKLDFQYKPPLKHLTPFTEENFREWHDEFKRGERKMEDMWYRARAGAGFPIESFSRSPKGALDVLNELFPMSKNES